MPAEVEAVTGEPTSVPLHHRQPFTHVAITGSRSLQVSPPSPSGGRRVRVDGKILGLAHDLRDLVKFL